MLTKSFSFHLPFSAVFICSATFIMIYGNLKVLVKVNWPVCMLTLENAGNASYFWTRSHISHLGNVIIDFHIHMRAFSKFSKIDLTFELIWCPKLDVSLF